MRCLQTPSRPLAWQLLAGAALLSWIPAEWGMLRYTLQRGDYPPWGDSIAIPAFGAVVLGVVGLPLVILGVEVCIWRRKLPAVLWRRPLVGNARLLGTAVLAATALMLLIVVDSVLSDFFAVPSAVMTCYLLLSCRAAAVGGSRMSKLKRVETRGRVEWVQPEGTHFITVDLEILSRTRLTNLVGAFGSRVLVLHEGRWGSRYHASVSLRNTWQLGADQEIRRLVRLVKSLTPSVRRLWNGAQSRVFDIGVQAGLTPVSHALVLSQDVVQAVASVQGRITITTYAPERSKK